MKRGREENMAAGGMKRPVRWEAAWVGWEPGAC